MIFSCVRIFRGDRIDKNASKISKTFSDDKKSSQKLGMIWSCRFWSPRRVFVDFNLSDTRKKACLPWSPLTLYGRLPCRKHAKWLKPPSSAQANLPIDECSVVWVTNLWVRSQRRLRRNHCLYKYQDISFNVWTFPDNIIGSYFYKSSQIT